MIVQDVNFEDCKTLKETVTRYLYYTELTNDEDKPFLDWMFYAYVHDCLEDDLWNATR